LLCLLGALGSTTRELPALAGVKRLSNGEPVSAAARCDATIFTGGAMMKSTALSIILAASIAIAPIAALARSSNANPGGASASHMSSQGLANTNGPNAADREKGLDRAQDRMSAQGLAHEKATAHHKATTHAATHKKNSTHKKSKKGSKRNLDNRQ
jgi:hypothetical protein